MSMVSYLGESFDGGQSLCFGGGETLAASLARVGEATFGTVFTGGGDLLLIGEILTGLFFYCMLVGAGA
jgi:hypothetical protein